jgi:hypothetical protein
MAFSPLCIPAAGRQFPPEVPAGSHARLMFVWLRTAEGRLLCIMYVPTRRSVRYITYLLLPKKIDETDDETTTFLIVRIANPASRISSQQQRFTHHTVVDQDHGGRVMLHHNNSIVNANDDSKLVVY